MTSTDKTRQKLLNSMRKTKAGSAAGKTPAKTSSSTSAKSPSSRSRAGSGAKARTKTKKKQTVSADPYQAARRVWPD